MKKAIVAFTLVMATTYAIAACPVYAPYRCVTGWNGKMICGCGV